MSKKKPFYNKKQQKNLNEILRRNLNNLLNEVLAELSQDERFPAQLCDVMDSTISEIEYAVNECLERLKSARNVDPEAITKLQELFKKNIHSIDDFASDRTDKSTNPDKSNPGKPGYISFKRT
jgi:hypothetical protein